jgi:hypothetical protein
VLSSTEHRVSAVAQWMDDGLSLLVVIIKKERLYSFTAYWATMNIEIIERCEIETIILKIFQEQ